MTSPPRIDRRTTRSGLSFLVLSEVDHEGSEKARRTLLTVFVPGFACRAEDFRELIVRLWELYQRGGGGVGYYGRSVWVAVDLPGHGVSSGKVLEGEELSIEGCARLVDEVVTEFRSDPDGHSGNEVDVVLAGHSMGSRVVLEAWRSGDNRKSVKGVVLIDASHYLLRGKGYLAEQRRTFAGRGAGNGTGARVESEQRQEGGTGDSSSTSETVSRHMQEKAVEILFSTMFSSRTPENFKTTALADAKRTFLDLVPLRASHLRWDQEKMDDTMTILGEGGEVQVLVIQSTDAQGAARIPLKAGEENAWIRFVREKVGEERCEVVILHGCGHFPHVNDADGMAGAWNTWLDTKLPGGGGGGGQGAPNKSVES